MRKWCILLVVLIALAFTVSAIGEEKYSLRNSEKNPKFLLIPQVSEEKISFNILITPLENPSNYDDRECTYICCDWDFDNNGWPSCKKYCRYCFGGPSIP